MSRKQKAEEKLLRLLQKASEQLELWSESKERAVAQLSSIANLAEQLEALDRCEAGGNVGVVAQVPMAASLLRGKIVESMERALERASKERQAISDVVLRLRWFARDGQSAFEELVAQQGLEESCERSPESFCPGDHVQWLTQLHTAYQCDLDERLAAWESVRYTSEAMRKVCSVWDRSPEGLQEMLTHMNYTLNCSKH